jgi:hypothetical protein
MRNAGFDPEDFGDDDSVAETEPEALPDALPETEQEPVPGADQAYFDPNREFEVDYR